MYNYFDKIQQKITLKKIIIFLLILTFIFIIIKSLLFPLYIRLFPPSLDLQLYFAVEKECKNQSNCMVHLHKLTPFQWDKAYFFAYNSDYGYQKILNINNITGITDDLKATGKRENLVLFTLEGKMVKYSFFETMDVENFNRRNFFFSMFFSEPSFHINFETNIDKLRQLHYSGNIDDFDNPYDYVGIKYYELTPENDLLRARCFYEDYSIDSFQNNYQESCQEVVKQCGFSFTHLDQIHLFNPKIDKKLH